MTKHDADRKVRILDFIAATLRTRGVPPSVREIARAVGLASTSAVHHHLQILEREGYLERGAAQARAIRLTPTAAIELGLSSELTPQSAAAEAHLLPIIGEIAAGGPIEAYQRADETLAVPDVFAPSGDAYVLKVRGDSMIDAHRVPADVLRRRPDPGQAHRGHPPPRLGAVHRSLHSRPTHRPLSWTEPRPPRPFVDRPDALSMTLDLTRIPTIFGVP